MSTTAAAAKAALITVFKALHAADADPVQVVYGPPDEETLQLPRLVSVGGVNAGSGDVDALDQGTTFELYVVDIITAVDLPVPGSDGQQLATETALALWTRQEARIRTDANGDLGLGAAGVFGGGVSVASTWQLQERVSERGRSAAIRWGVQITGQRQ